MSSQERTRKTWKIADLDNKKGGWALTDPFNEDFWSSFYIPIRTCSRLGCGFLVDHGWGTSSERNHRNHKFITQHKSHKSHPSYPSSHCHPPLIGWYSTPLWQCKSSRYYGITHIAFLPPDPTLRYMLHTWDIHGYDTACMVNQMTVGSWITFNSMTSRYSFFNQYLLDVVQVWSSSLYMFTIFSEISREKSELSWLVSEALVCPIFSKQILWIGWKVTAMESIWICWCHFGMSSLRSSCILQVLDRRWKMRKLQVPDVRSKVKGCWCVAVHACLWADSEQTCN